MHCWSVRVKYIGLLFFKFIVDALRLAVIAYSNYYCRCCHFQIYEFLSTDHQKKQEGYRVRARKQKASD